MIRRRRSRLEILTTNAAMYVAGTYPRLCYDASELSFFDRPFLNSCSSLFLCPSFTGRVTWQYGVRVTVSELRPPAGRRRKKKQGRPLPETPPDQNCRNRTNRTALARPIVPADYVITLCIVPHCIKRSFLKMSEQDDSLKPLSKRQKRGGVEKEPPEPIAFGGPMYDEATARKILQKVRTRFDDGDNSDDEFQGFDPNDAASLDNNYDFFMGNTALIHFADKGDAKMCRYLISRGASTTKAGRSDDYYLYYFPMYVAALRGHLEVCKLLYENGAKNDVRRRNGQSWTPFLVAATHRQTQVVRWLVLHGALCSDNSSEDIDGSLFEWRNQDVVNSCDDLVKWADKVTQSHSALITFLGGALPPAPNQKQSRMLQCLSGHPGVRKHIGDFVGLEVTKGKHLRILRNVVKALPSFTIKR